MKPTLGAFLRESLGGGFGVIREVPVLALSPKALNSTVFLYPDEKSAIEGHPYGGSGFIACVPSAVPPRVYPYVVTNRHVIDGGFLTIRFNLKDGTCDTMQTTADDWVLSDEDDLAVLSTELPSHVEWGGISTEIFLGEDCLVNGWPVCPGDEVFFHGRLVTQDGTQKNRPVVRFGNISMLSDADALIPVDGGPDQLAFLVDCRSLTGFSGSPAYVVLASTRPFDGTPPGPIPRKGDAVKFLGVVCSNIPWRAPVESYNPKTHAFEAVQPEMWVETNGGITVVIPAWRLLRLLNAKVLMDPREDIERKRLERAKNAGKAVPNVSQPPKENFTKDNFENALKRVTRKLSDEEKSET